MFVVVCFISVVDCVTQKASIVCRSTIPCILRSKHLNKVGAAGQCLCAHVVDTIEQGGRRGVLFLLGSVASFVVVMAAVHNCPLFLLHDGKGFFEARMHTAVCVGILSPVIAHSYDQPTTAATSLRRPDPPLFAHAHDRASTNSHLY